MPAASTHSEALLLRALLQLSLLSPHAKADLVLCYKPKALISVSVAVRTRRLLFVCEHLLRS